MASPVDSAAGLETAAPLAPEIISPSDAVPDGAPAPTLFASESTGQANAARPARDGETSPNTLSVKARDEFFTAWPDELSSSTDFVGSRAAVGDVTFSAALGLPFTFTTGGAASSSPLGGEPSLSRQPTPRLPAGPDGADADFASFLHNRLARQKSASGTGGGEILGQSLSGGTISGQLTGDLSSGTIGFGGSVAIDGDSGTFDGGGTISGDTFSGIFGVNIGEGEFSGSGTLSGSVSINGSTISGSFSFEGTGSSGGALLGGEENVSGSGTFTGTIDGAGFISGSFSGTIEIGGPAGSIGNYVYHDSDGDGIQDPAELGIEGVTVRLYEGDPASGGTLVDSTVTDPDGLYQFDSLAEGTYYVGVELLDGFAFSPANEGADDEADSDVEGQGDDGFGYTAAFALAEGEQKDSVDAGMADYTLTIEYLPNGEHTTGDLSEDNPDGTNGTPDFKGGWRFFPDAESYPTRNVPRNKVHVRVVLDKDAVGVPIYFRAFDVDDPSGNNTIDPNGADGRDNRGTVDGMNLDKPGDLATNGYQGRLRPASGMTFAAEGAVVEVKTTLNGALNKGVAEVVLATSFNPGDNFRVVASLNKAKLAALDDETGVPTTGNVPDFTGAATEQLSVWRHFHIERDTMKAIPWGSKLTGNITAATDTNETTRESVVTLDKPLAAGDVDKYLGAILYDKDGFPFTIMKIQTGNPGKVTVYVHTANMVKPPNGAFTIYKGDAVEAKIVSTEDLEDGLYEVVVKPGVLALENQFQGGLLRAGGKNYHIVYSDSGTTDVRLQILSSQAPGAVNDAVTVYEDDYSVTGDRLGTWVQTAITASGQPQNGEVEITIDRSDIANDRFAGGKLVHYGNGVVYEIVSVTGDKVKVKATAALPTTTQNKTLTLWVPINNNEPTPLINPTDPANLYDMSQGTTKRAENRYADAYLEPVLTSLSDYSNTEVTPANHVARNTGNSGLEAVFDQHRGPNPRPADYETDLFWVVYVSTAYESHIGSTNDGNLKSARGTTHGDGLLSAIFLETIRDGAAHSYATNMQTHIQVSEAISRARVTVHEIGHQFGHGHDNPDPEEEIPKNIMQEDTSNMSDAEFYFLPKHIVKMREQIQSPPPGED